MLIPIPAFPRRALPQGQRVRLQEREEDRLHPEHVRRSRGSDLYSTVQCKFAFYSRRCEYRPKERRLFRFQHSRGGHLLPHERHREAEPRGLGLTQARHARLPER